MMGIIPNWMNVKLAYEKKMSGFVSLLVLITYVVSLFLIRNTQTHS